MFTRLVQQRSRQHRLNVEFAEISLRRWTNIKIKSCQCFVLLGGHSSIDNEQNDLKQIIKSIILQTIAYVEMHIIKIENCAGQLCEAGTNENINKKNTKKYKPRKDTNKTMASRNLGRNNKINLAKIVK